jgi:Sec-independent protein translocase protein TatA
MNVTINPNTSDRAELVEAIELLTHSLNRLDATPPTATVKLVGADKAADAIAEAGAAVAEIKTETTIQQDIEAGQAQATQEAAAARAAAELQAQTPAPGTTGPANYDTLRQPPAASADVDSEGLPWDKRIHSSGKTKIAAGTWKMKKGVAAELVEQVKTELRLTHSATTGADSTAAIAPPPAQAPAAPVVAPPPAATEPERYMVGENSFTAEELIAGGWSEDQVADLPVAAPAAPTASTTTDWTFPDLIQAIAANNIPADQVTAAVTSVGLASQVLLGTRPDLVPQVAELLGLG